MSSSQPPRKRNGTTDAHRCTQIRRNDPCESVCIGGFSSFFSTRLAKRHRNQWTWRRREFFRRHAYRFVNLGSQKSPGQRAKSRRIVRNKTFQSASLIARCGQPAGLQSLGHILGTLLGGVNHPASHHAGDQPFVNRIMRTPQHQHIQLFRQQRLKILPQCHSYNRIVPHRGRLR